MRPTVLVCDDALGFRVMLGAFLSDAGHDVSFGCTWADSLARATEHQPDAILVDLWMPTYDPALLRALRAASPRSVIVVVSALPTDASTRVVAGIAGIAAVVSKRDRPDAIVAVTEALLARQQQAPDAPPSQLTTVARDSGPFRATYGDRESGSAR